MSAAIRLVRTDETNPPARGRLAWGLALLAAALATLTARGDDSAPGGSPAWRELLTKLMTPAPGAALPLTPDAEPPAATSARLDENRIVTTETGALDIHVRNTEIDVILEAISFQTQSNIVSTQAVTGQISANLYAVSLSEALDAILTPNNFAYRRAGSTIFVGTAEEIAAQLPPPETRVFRLRYLTRAEATTILKGVISAKGKIGNADETSSGDSAADSDAGKSVQGGPTAVEYLVVSDTTDRLEAAARLLAELDIRPRQVLIEATILRASLNEGNQFGIDFTMLGGIDFQTVGSSSAATTNIITGELPPDDLQHTTMNANTNLIGDLSRGFTFGFINNNIAAFIKALESVTDVSVIANPKVLALNRQDAQVIVGRRDGYITTTVTETAAVQKVEFLETGTQIRIRPFVNDDGTVRLIVHPKDSNGGLTAANLPFEETTEAQGDILINDGRTVLIGGLFRERTVSSREQVPVIGNVPFLGMLFQRQSNDTVREEVIILLTVHVLKDTHDESARQERLLDDIERIRVGSRKGLLATGRERLAQAYYQEALAQYENGEFDRALLNVRMALHNQPRHLTALKLKEELLGKRIWDSTGTRSRTYLHDLIRLEKPAAERDRLPQVFGRPPLDLELEREPTPRQPSREKP
jgi:type IV pilus assembly protein PilQ